MKIWKVNSLATWVGKKDHLCLVWHIRVTSWDLHNLESYEIQQLLGLTLLEVGAYVRCYVRVTFTTFDATTPIPSLLPPSGKSPSQANWTSGCPTPLCFYKSASIISLYIYIYIYTVHGLAEVVLNFILVVDIQQLTCEHDIEQSLRSSFYETLDHWNDLEKSHTLDSSFTRGV